MLERLASQRRASLRRSQSQQLLGDHPCFPQGLFSTLACTRSPPTRNEGWGGCARASELERNPGAHHVHQARVPLPLTAKAPAKSSRSGGGPLSFRHSVRGFQSHSDDDSLCVISTLGTVTTQEGTTARAVRPDVVSPHQTSNMAQVTNS